MMMYIEIYHVCMYNEHDGEPSAFPVRRTLIAYNGWLRSSGGSGAGCSRLAEHISALHTAFFFLSDRRRHRRVASNLIHQWAIPRVDCTGDHGLRANN